VGVIASRERLSNGSPEWTEYGLRMSHTLVLQL
jgi:hypothetical protein